MEYIQICESRGNPNAKSPPEHPDGTRSYGLYQFFWGTWVHHAKIFGIVPKDKYFNFGIAVPYMKDPAYNAAVAHGMFKLGIKDRSILENNWTTCYKKYRLTLR